MNNIFFSSKTKKIKNKYFASAKQAITKQKVATENIKLQTTFIYTQYKKKIPPQSEMHSYHTHYIFQITNFNAQT